MSTNAAGISTAGEEVHDIRVRGQWFNDETAGVYIWCRTCDNEVLNGEPFGDQLSPAQIAEAVVDHLRLRGGASGPTP